MAVLTTIMAPTACCRERGLRTYSAICVGVVSRMSCLLLAPRDRLERAPNLGPRRSAWLVVRSTRLHPEAAVFTAVSADGCWAEVSTTPR
jgi:hypothetical protein